MSVIKLDKKVYLLRDEQSKNAAFVEVYPADTAYGDKPFGSNAFSRVATSPQIHVRWGVKDDQPNVMHQIATDNDVKWALLNTKRDFTIASGLRFGIESPDGELIELPTAHQNYVEIKEHIDEMAMSGYSIDSTMQVCFSGNLFAKIQIDKRGRAMPLDFQDCFNIRYRAIQEGERKSGAFLLNAAFGTRYYRPFDSETIPIFNPANPTQFPTSVFHSKHRLPGQPYYAFPPWWGTKTWTEVANQIPKYHLSGLTKGYNIKYLIKIPDDYFEKAGLETQEAIDAYTQEVLLDMKKSLAGEADRAMVTFYKHDINSMKALPGVIVESLKNEMTDDAYVSLYNTAKAAQASGHDIHPTLAGIDTNSKLGGSGLEMEVAAMFTQKFKTYSDRQLLIRPISMIQKINGWDKNIVFKFKDIIMYNPDSTPINSPANPNNPKNKKTNGDANQ